MSVKSRCLTLLHVLSRPSLLSGDFRSLLIVRHMCSRSTVLDHILGSNHEVCGHAELHRAYRRKADLLKIRVALSKEVRCRLVGKYLLDKILHDRYSLVEYVFPQAGPSTSSCCGTPMPPSPP